MGGSGALLPGRNVAVVHISGDDNSYPASVSLKEPQTQKPLLLKPAYCSRAHPEALEGRSRGWRGGCDFGEQEEGGDVGEGRGQGPSLKEKKHS